MDKNTKTTLEQFTKKALQRLQDKRKCKTVTLYVPSLDEEIVIRSLLNTEIVECTSIEDENDPNRCDRYAIYLACKKPDLKAVAAELKKAGEITEPIEVVDIFDISEQTQIATEIMKLSGVIGTKPVTVIEQIKN